MPFADYNSFSDCVSENADKEDPKAYCATIMRSVEGKSYSFFTNSISIEVKGTKDKEYFITGYISTPDRDLVNDIVTEKAFNDMLNQMANKTIKLDVEHNSWNEAYAKGAVNSIELIPIGKVVEGKRDNKGIFIKGQLNPAHPNFEQVWASIKGGFLDAFSIAFKATDYVYKVVDGVKTRMLNGMELLNVAITGNPVNPECRMTDVFVKSIKDIEVKEMAEDKTKAEEEEEKKKAEAEKKAAEDKEKADVEAKAAAETEKKSLIDTNVKLAEELKALKEEHTKTTEELKAVTKKLEEPIFKSRQTDANKGVIAKKSKSPLDTI